MVRRSPRRRNTTRRQPGRSRAARRGLSRTSARGPHQSKHRPPNPREPRRVSMPVGPACVREIAAAGSARRGRCAGRWASLSVGGPPESVSLIGPLAGTILSPGRAEGREEGWESITIRLRRTSLPVRPRTIHHAPLPGSRHRASTARAARPLAAPVPTETEAGRCAEPGEALGQKPRYTLAAPFGPSEPPVPGRDRCTTTR